MSIKYAEPAPIPVPDPSNVCAISLPKSEKSNLPVHPGSDSLSCLCRTHPGNMAYHWLSNPETESPEYSWIPGLQVVGRRDRRVFFKKNSPKRLWWSASVKVNKVCEYLLLIPQEETWEPLWSDSTDLGLYVKLKLLIEQAQFIFSSEPPLVPPRL